MKINKLLLVASLFVVTNGFAAIYQLPEYFNCLSQVCTPAEPTSLTFSVNPTDYPLPDTLYHFIYAVEKPTGFVIYYMGDSHTFSANVIAPPKGYTVEYLNYWTLQNNNVDYYCNYYGDTQIQNCAIQDN